MASNTLTHALNLNNTFKYHFYIVNYGLQWFPLLFLFCVKTWFMCGLCALVRTISFGRYLTCTHNIYLKNNKINIEFRSENW